MRRVSGAATGRTFPFVNGKHVCRKRRTDKKGARLLKKILTVVGARPQFIKAAPVSREIRKHLCEVLIHTGQHYDYQMSEVFFRELGIPAPDRNLDVGSGSHGAQIGQMLMRLEEVVDQERPDMILVFGDTNSTLAGALIGAKLRIPVAHVEAGLRSFNKTMTEEVNRVIADHISTILFCPSEIAVRNLAAEGIARAINDGKLFDANMQITALFGLVDISTPLVINVGDVMYDALLHASTIADERSTALRTLGLTPKRYQILTVHRAENTDDPDRFDEIIDFVNRTSRGTTVIFPMHPRTRKVIDTAHNRFHDLVRITEPFGYYDMLALVKNSALVYTDSGGLQKEAYWFQVPCITLRQETEWVETVAEGWNVLYREYRGSHGMQVPGTRLYGDGKAAEKIATILSQWTGRKAQSTS